MLNDCLQSNPKDGKFFLYFTYPIPNKK